MKNSGTNLTKQMIYKCNSCSNNALPSNSSRAYYCCEPFQQNKILCFKCKSFKRPCNQCKKDVASYEITLSKIEKIKQTKPIHTQTQRTPNSKVLNKLQQKCFECEKQFKYPEMSLFRHVGCKHQLCFPCLYKKYRDQKQEYQDIGQQIKRQERFLYLNCCNVYGPTLQSYEFIFKQDLCIFCGIRTEDKQCMFKIQNQFQVCRSCLNSQLKSYNETDSVKLIKRQIEKRIPHQCLFCEGRINISECPDYKSMLAFNRKLCVNCFETHSKAFPNPVDLLKSFRVFENVSKRCRNEQYLNYFKCCQPTCGKKVLGSFKESKKQKSITELQAEFDLVEWRNNKIYCGICLYFKYQNKRRSIMDKIRNKQVSQVQIQQLQAEKTSYQNYFDNKCLICLTQPTKQNRHRLLIGKDNREYQIQLQQHKLQCEYCQKCLLLISQEDIEDIKLLNMRQQMFKRDGQLKSTLFEIKYEKKCFLFKQYSKLAILTNSQFKKFWPIQQKINKEKKQQHVKNKYLSLSNKSKKESSHYQIDQQKYSTQKNQNQQQSDKSGFNQFKNLPKQSQTYQNKTNQFEQPDFDNQTYQRGNKQHQNKKHQQKSKDFNLQKKNTQFNNRQGLNQNKQRKISQPEIFLSVCLQSFQEQQEINHQINLYEYQNISQSQDGKIFGKDKHILHQFMLSEEVSDQISNFPHEQMWKQMQKFNIDSSMKNNTGRQIEMKNQYNDTSINNKLITRSIKDISLNKQQNKSQRMKLMGKACKVLSCVLRKTNGSNKRVDLKQDIQKYQINMIEENSLQLRDEDLLNLGVMCDNCFIRYLMGVIELESGVSKDIYQYHKQSAMEQQITIGQQVRSYLKQKEIDDDRFIWIYDTKCIFLFD